MNDALDLLWPLIDSPEPTLAASVVAAWPEGVHKHLLTLGFMQPAEDASRVLCPECGEHEEDVVASDGSKGRMRFSIPCPKVLRADVPAKARRQWTVNMDAVAAALASTLGLSGRCTELVARRLWRLGRTDWQGASRDVLFARGLDWGDAATTRAAIVRGRKPIVFVPFCVPPEDFWRRRIPPVIVLSQFTMLCDDQMELEPLAVATAIRDADATPSSGPLETVTEEQLKLMIRQQIKAESKSECVDAVLVAAYRHCGTYRSAADYLSKETGRAVTKDAVHRAVQRAGGVLAVLNSEDSNSVVRSVASQRRDKTGKPIRQSKPIEEE
jgi:hypothetical protein